MASRALDDLDGDVKALALAFLLECQRRGLPNVLIYCTLRSNEEQAKLYAQGRSKSGAIVTNAKAGQSLHNPNPKTGKARAFDAVPISATGALLWDDSRAIAIMGAAGEAVGLEWAGRWAGFREKVHFQKKAAA
jgi:peptidoglycan L-alanyl-D-glutamate endopeptidase CwlK